MAGAPVDTSDVSEPSAVGATLVGWREWAGLPDWGVEWLKVKVDTGARTSAIHATDVEHHERDGEPWVRFVVHPWQGHDGDSVVVDAPLVESRDVTSSSGDTTHRPVLVTKVRLGDEIVEIELTLTNRDELGFRMLLGREAMRGRYHVDPGSSYLLGRPRRPIRDLNRATS